MISIPLPPPRPDHTPALSNEELCILGVLSAPDTPHTAATLCSATALSPPALRSVLLRLWWAGCLGPHPSAPRAPEGPPPGGDAALLPMRFAPDLRHACQGCGGCCSASDIGPIPPHQARDLLAQDWPSTVTPPLQAVSVQGQLAYVAAKENDICTFLDENTRCRIHARLGAEAKPLPCRQFPWRFTRVGQEIHVSLYAECRAWSRATHPDRAPDPTILLPEFRALLARRSIPHLPAVLAVDGRVQAARSAYLAAEDDLIAAIRAARGDWLSPLRALAAAGGTMLSALGGDLPTWLAAPLWMASFPDEDWRGHRTARLKALLASVQEFARHAQAVAAERGLPWLALRLAFLARAVDATQDVRPLALRTPPDQADLLRKMLADLLVSVIFAKEAARPSLRLGLARLWLRAWLTIHSAAARAHEACRVQLLPQDLNDSMVTLSKVFREPAMAGLMEQLAPDLLDALGENLPTC